MAWAANSPLFAASSIQSWTMVIPSTSSSTQESSGPRSPGVAATIPEVATSAARRQ